MSEEDESNEYYAEEDGGKHEESYVEFCPFCAEIVVTIDGICYKCGNELPEDWRMLRDVSEDKKEEYRGLGYLSEEELGEKTKIDDTNPLYSYYLGKKLFKKYRKGEEWFRKTIELEPHFYMAYYYLGRLHLEKGELSEAGSNFKKAITNKLDLAWAHYYLGEVLLKKGELIKAESELKKALEINPTLEGANVYLEEIKLRKSKVEFPETVEEVEKLTENIVLSNHALVEWFETNLRDFIKKILEKEYGEEWWDESVPLKVRKKCVGRKEEAQKEEKKTPKLYFADFYDYAEIISNTGNKGIFNPYFKDIKKWRHALNELEVIRNGVMHSRGQYLSKERNLKLKEWCYDLQNIIKNARAGS
ncbi:MAG: tetratricopeptide repeat protein [Nanoarchaeota archaeon]|nr:tetratricopeptide repeat protein [Nanoarchaeota archaeon]